MLMPMKEWRYPPRSWTTSEKTNRRCHKIYFRKPRWHNRQIKLGIAYLGASPVTRWWWSEPVRSPCVREPTQRRNQAVVLQWIAKKEGSSLKLDHSSEAPGRNGIVTWNLWPATLTSMTGQIIARRGGGRTHESWTTPAKALSKSSMLEPPSKSHHRSISFDRETGLRKKNHDEEP